MLIMSKDNLLAENIRFMRKAKGFSQDQFGNLFNVSRCTIGYIEQCRVSPTYRVLCNIASALDTNVNILGGKFSSNIHVGDILITFVGKQYNEYFKLTDNKKDGIVLVNKCLSEIYKGKTFNEIITNINFPNKLLN